MMGSRGRDGHPKKAQAAGAWTWPRGILAENSGLCGAPERSSLGQKQQGCVPLSGLGPPGRASWQRPGDPELAFQDCLENCQQTFGLVLLGLLTETLIPPPILRL